MFQESKTKRSPMQIVGIVVIFILAVMIVLTFVLFGIFKDSNSAPKFFGYRVYVVSNDRMEPRIPEGSAVFVEEGTLPQPGSQSVILCNIEGSLYVIGYVGTETTETGAMSYIVKYDNATDDRTWGISQADIVGVAQTYDEFFGWLIRFTSSKAGMMLIVIIPCLLIIVYEVGMLLLSRKHSDDDSVWRRSSEDESASKKTKSAKEPIIRRVGGGPDPEDIPPEREDIHIPMDTATEERYVEKQLRRANDRLSTTILETAGEVEPEEISLEPLAVDSEDIPRQTAPFFAEPPKPAFEPTRIIQPEQAEPKPEPKPAPAEEKPLSASIGDLSASRIDELIKLLEEEKRRLGDK